MSSVLLYRRIPVSHEEFNSDYCRKNAQKQEQDTKSLLSIASASFCDFLSLFAANDSVIWLRLRRAVTNAFPPLSRIALGSTDGGRTESFALSGRTLSRR